MNHTSFTMRMQPFAPDSNWLPRMTHAAENVHARHIELDRAR
jgi:hypothetical protein